VSDGVWRIFYGGEWRTVTHLLRIPGEHIVRHPEQANAVVIEIDGEYLPLAVTPGEIFSEWFPRLPAPDDWKPV
jgi:hypothetical protein